LFGNWRVVVQNCERRTEERRCKFPPTPPALSRKGKDHAGRLWKGTGLPVAEETVELARGGDRASVEAVITECFPAVHRVAHALVGEPVVAGKVVRFVLRRAVTVRPRWRPGMTPENWFFHNTLMTLRRLGSVAPPSGQDLLITAASGSHPAYTAFVRALRALPVQQAEAFILHHGEHLNERLLGVAMDLSTGAAGSHLAAATQGLQGLAGEDYPVLVAALEKTYAALTPPETIVRTAAQSEIKAVFWGRVLRRVVRRVISLAILAALAYLGWRYREQLVQWYYQLRAAVTSATSRPS
jgi:DNA-directed RNA polymerase specialized sigma24 family protein